MLGRIYVALAFAVLVAGTSAVGAATQDVPGSKRTALEKYLTAKEAYDQVKAEREKVLFVDVRTVGEVMFVGHAEETDAFVPFVEVVHPLTWDDKAGRFALKPNTSFVSNVDAALAKKRLSKADKVFVMCRSGDRSAKAVNLLAAHGYSNAWSVYDGFEGDMSKEGRRSINGWKNSDLPWSYKLDKAKFLMDLSPAN